MTEWMSGKCDVLLNVFCLALSLPPRCSRSPFKVAPVWKAIEVLKTRFINSQPRFHLGNWLTCKDWPSFQAEPESLQGDDNGHRLWGPVLDRPWQALLWEDLGLVPRGQILSCYRADPALCYEDQAEPLLDHCFGYSHHLKPHLR